MTFDIWTVPMALPYPIPGPVVYAPTSNSTTHMSTLVQTEGLWPAHCVLENANWCGTELSDYTTEDGCWNASTNCWAQCTDCFDSAPPTGSVNCPIWEAKCTDIQSQCRAGNFDGPPNAGKILTPAFETISLPAPVPAQTDGGSYIVATVSGSASAVSTASQASSSASPIAYMPMTISTDGSCGANITCMGSKFGNCCSPHGFCGSADDLYSLKLLEAKGRSSHRQRGFLST